VVDDQLALSIEEFGQLDITIRPVEKVVLFDLGPRQGTPQQRDLVSHFREFLLFDKQLGAGLRPGVGSDDRVIHQFGFLDLCFHWSSSYVILGVQGTYVLRFLFPTSARVRT